MSRKLESTSERIQKVMMDSCSTTGVGSASTRIRAQVLEHTVDRGEIDQGFADLGQLLVVFAEAPVATEPAQGSLHDPATRQDEEVALRG